MTTWRDALSHRSPALASFVACVVIACARSGEPPVESQARFCRRAADLLRPPASDSAYRTALPMLYSCPEEGGALIAQLWQAPPSNDTTLSLLVGVAGHIHDGRIYEATRAAAADRGRTGKERLAALLTLVSHYNPYLFGHDWGRPAYPGAPANQVGIGQSVHLLLAHGAVPLPHDVGFTIPELYAQLGASDPDPQIRYAAGQLYRQIRGYAAGEQNP